MRLAFLIRRKNYYRPLGPVIEEALRRGLQAECWHDYRGTPRGGKASEFPDLVPAFRAGGPTVHRFDGSADLAEKFRADPPDAVICLDPPDPDVRAVAKARWIWLQYSTDLVFYRSPQGILDSEAVGTYSPYWAQKVEERYRDTGLGAELRRKLVAVGMPELDVVRTIDPEEVRRRYGLPPGRPVVLYLAFPLRSNPRTFWLRHVFTPSTRLEQGLRALLGRRPEYWPHVVNRWNDRRLVEAVRAFCDRNGALLVIKSRLKDPVPRYARRLADRVLYDPWHYPPTILELLSVASLCIHSYSTAVLEAAYCGVPSLCVAPDAADMGLETFWAEFVHNGKPRGIYNWPGVAYWKPLRAAFDGLPRWGLPDFGHDPEAQRSYVERFLGCDDGRSSGRLLDLVVRCVQAEDSMSSHRAEVGSADRAAIRGRLEEYYTRYYRDTLAIPAWRDLVGVRVADDAYEGRRLARLEQALGRPVRDLRLLNVGCGTGGFNVVAERAGAEAWGVDTSAEALAIAERRVQDGRLLCAQAESLPFPDGAFDVVYCYSTLEHVADAPRALSEMVRVLRPEGELYLHTPNRWGCFESHYKIFWIPGLPPWAGRAYLTARGRPTGFLESLRPLAFAECQRMLREAGARVVRAFRDDPGRPVGGPLWSLIRLYYWLFRIHPYVELVAVRAREP